jgi:CheY-like chemotaxis protein
MTSPAVPGAADVLLVEDDPGDVLLTREAFEDHHLGLQLHVVGDGETAMRFLRRTDDFAGMARPALVVLDLNLPRRSGLEVLGELKAEPGLHTIPVVVLTTSQGAGRHLAQLRAARQRLHHQAVRRRPVRRRDQAHRRLLPDLGQAPALDASARPPLPGEDSLLAKEVTATSGPAAAHVKRAAGCSVMR